MEYKVIHAFHDLQDKTKEFPDGREYAVGDLFPATKRTVSKERIELLLGAENPAGIPLIEKVGYVNDQGSSEPQPAVEKKAVPEK
ncbi:hypothetical protein ACQRBK_07230 [Peptoniphilaceae bacterium SGI.137]